MRPLRLTIEGFGSFAEKQVIDFTQLAERRLFLIHGPTGAGKTTVLDAICFALYGDTTGGERDGKGMRSDFVGPDVDTQVTLDFEVGPKIYRAWRQPAYERMKLRGEGMTQTLGKAELWDRTGVQSSEDEGELLASGISNVSSTVERVLGFRSEQFRQVIVLPQGQFRDLLLAKSKEREEILQQLFDTSFYAQVQEELKARGKSLRDKAADLRTRRSLLLEQVGAEDEAHLRTQATEVESDRALADKRAVSLAKKATKAARALARGETDNKKFEQLQEAETALEVLQGQAAEIERAKASLEAAQRADRLEDIAEALVERRMTADEAKRAEEKARDASAAAASVLEETGRVLKKAQLREPDHKALREKLTEMRRVRPILEQLEVAITERDAAEQAHAEITAKLEAEEEKLGQLGETIEQTEAAISAAQKELGERTVVEATLEKANKALSDREALDKLLLEEQALLEVKVSAEADLEAARKSITTAKSGLSKLVKAREAASAALLAKELAPDQPCPVCGSKKHPAPAKSRRKVPAEEDVAEAQAVLEDAENAFEEAREALNEAKSGLADLGGEIRALKKTLGKAGSKAFAELREKRAAAVAALTQHDRAKAQLERNRDNLAEDKKELKALGPQVAQTRKQSGVLARALATAAATLKAREDQVPDDWRDLEQLDRSIRQSENALSALEQDLKQAEDAEKKARLEATRCASELKSATRQRDATAKALTKALAEWEKRLSGAGFPTERDYRDALLPDVEMDTIQARIERYGRDLVAAQTTAKNARGAVDGLDRPDIEALQASAKKAEAARGQAADECARLSSQKDAIHKVLASLEAVSTDLVEVEHLYGVMGRIAGVANGDNKHRISLQRFVLAARLDDVLACASKRLSLMSRGRYLLRRNTSAEDRRSAGGLELEIEDAYTAKSRPVSTLSGGESFQAALALALGLSEVVQAYAGGIRLDTIFVDEGFGSLDPEALDLAINTLIDLQQSGRMVGVISHVPELRERIDVRLEINAGKSGSRARFRLP